jgi:hypothetical protein
MERIHSSGSLVAIVFSFVFASGSPIFPRVRTTIFRTFGEGSLALSATASRAFVVPSLLRAEFEKKVKLLEERSRLSGISDESSLEVEMKEEDIKETLRDVLNELYSKETKKKRLESS